MIKKVVKAGIWLAFYCLTGLLIAVGRIVYAFQRKPAGQERIIVIRLDEIGDMVLLSPFLRELRRGRPEAEIILVVKTAVYNLVELCPYVNEVLAYPRPGGRWMRLKQITRAFAFARDHLWRRSLTLAIVPRFDADAGYGAGWLAFFSGAPRRIAYRARVLPTKARSDLGFDRLYTEFVPARPGVLHEVERNLDVLRYLGIAVQSEALEVWVDAQDEARAQKLLSSGGGTCLVVVLSAGSVRREWAVEKYAAVVRSLKAASLKLSVVLLGAGSRAEAKGTSFCAQVTRTVNLIGKCTLRESAAVLAGARAYLGGDTGLMHMAAALGRRGVVLSCHPWGAAAEHPNSPQRFGPWQSRLRVLRPAALPGCEEGCTRDIPHCINEITVTEAAAALQAALGERV